MKNLLIAGFLSIAGSVIFGQCPGNLVVNGSFTDSVGVNRTAPGWTGFSTPDINDTGALNTTPGYIWSGTPVPSADGGTWQNLFIPESVVQTLTVTPGFMYSLTFEYATQGIYIPGSTANTYTSPTGADVVINGNIVYSAPLDTTPFTWETAQYTFIAQGQILNLRISSNKSAYLAIDGVCISGLETGGREQKQLPGAIVYPDPLNERLIIRLNGQVTDPTFEIYNCTGRLVRSEQLLSGSEFEITDQGLERGFYILRILEKRQQILEERFIVSY